MNGGKHDICVMKGDVGGLRKNLTTRRIDVVELVVDRFLIS